MRWWRLRQEILGRTDSTIMSRWCHPALANQARCEEQIVRCHGQGWTTLASEGSKWRRAQEHTITGSRGVEQAVSPAICDHGVGIPVVSSNLQCFSHFPVSDFPVLLPTLRRKLGYLLQDGDFFWPFPFALVGDSESCIQQLTGLAANSGASEASPICSSCRDLLFKLHRIFRLCLLAC